MRSTLLAIGGIAPRSHLVALSELLHACLLRVHDQARPALKALLAESGFPTERATPESKARFERAIIRQAPYTSPDHVVGVICC